jgi:hypothetical protein
MSEIEFDGFVAEVLLGLLEEDPAKRIRMS